MDLLQKKKELGLFYDLLSEQRVKSAPPSKIATPPPAARYFPRATPESRGLSSALLLSMLQKFEENENVNLHAITVVCDGAVVCEASRAPYRRQIPHVTYSMCKSVVGIAIGMLSEEGKIDLDEPAYSYFAPDMLPKKMSERMKAVTVRHLLTMSSGVTFAEIATATEEDWLRAFFSSSQKFEPGSDFAYNSLNTYVLSAVIRAVSGEGLVDYLRPRLFDPLHIEHVFWETCPRGIEKGGWGLYIAQEDMAKIGWLCLSHGCFEGKQLISASYLAEATRISHLTPNDTGHFHYGYHIWCAEDGGSYLFNGMLGQNTWICPQNRTVVVINAGNDELFQKCDMLAILEETLGPAVHRVGKRPPDRRNCRALRAAEKTFGHAQRLPLLQRPSLFARLLARLFRRPIYPLPSACPCGEITFSQNRAGILPLFMRMQQGNHTDGLRALRLSHTEESFFLTFSEGQEEYRIECGFYAYRDGLLTVGGECYRTACAGCLVPGEAGETTLRLHLVFTELSHERHMTLTLHGDRARLYMDETPGQAVVLQMVEPEIDRIPLPPMRDGIRSFVYPRIEKLYFPSLDGVYREEKKELTL